MYLPTSLHEQDEAKGQFLVKFNRSEFRLFFLLDWVPNQG